MKTVRCQELISVGYRNIWPQIISLQSTWTKLTLIVNPTKKHSITRQQHPYKNTDCSNNGWRTRKATFSLTRWSDVSWWACNGLCNCENLNSYCAVTDQLHRKGQMGSKLVWIGSELVYDGLRVVYFGSEISGAVWNWFRFWFRGLWTAEVRSAGPKPIRLDLMYFVWVWAGLGWFQTSLDWFRTVFS